jgi:DHA1 family multidrug resistance protein-like MFS transporter
MENRLPARRMSRLRVAVYHRRQVGHGMEEGSIMAGRQRRPESPPDAWRTSTRRFSPFVALCTVGFLGRLSYEMMRTPLTPLFAHHLGAPPQLIGLIVAAVTITGIFVKLPAGALADLFGFRRLMMTGAWVKASGPFLYLLAVSWPALLVIRFYHGLATAIYAPPASAVVAKAYPHERGYRLGIYNGSENAGVVLGPVLGGVVLTLTASDFRLAAIISGLIGIASLLAMLGVPRDQPDAAAEPATDTSRRHRLAQVFHRLVRGVHEVMTDRQILRVSLVEAMLWMGIGSVQAYLPLYALTIHLPAWEIGVLAGAQGVASVWSRPIMGRRSDRLASRTPLIVGGSVLCIGTLIAIPYAGNFATLLGLGIVFGLGTGIVTPSTMALIGDLVKKGNYGSAMGVFGSLWDIGHAGGPVVFGFLLVGLGYRTAWLIMALVMAAALVVFLLGGHGRAAAAR